jgi:hypothetical protein
MLKLLSTCEARCGGGGCGDDGRCGETTACVVTPSRQAVTITFVASSYL